ncbi:MAG: hypothetical protein JXA28_02185 [Bacteroidetes bacterium]|nr:hypothetical protein [Bacteroidota bacterium]
MVRVLALFFLLPVLATAQVGTWHTYTDMKIVRDVAIAADGIWAATGGGLFHVSSDRTFTRYTNVDGLSAIDYSAIARHDDGTVIAGANTGMINVLDPETGWYAVTDIVRTTDILQRGITVIHLHADRAYIGTEFGLTVFDPLRREFGDTYQKFGSLRAQLPVSGILIDGNRIWVTTSEGVAYGDLRNINLKDPASWTAQEIGDVKSITLLGGIPVIATQQALHRYNGETWEEFLSTMPVGEVRRLESVGNDALLLTSDGLYRVTSGGVLSQVGDRVSQAIYPDGTELTDVLVAGDEIIVASNVGVSRFTTGQSWDFLKPEGPNSNFISDLAVDREGLLWAASGFRSGGKGMYAFDGERWMNFTRSSHPDVRTDAITAAAAAADGSTWFATWGDGVFERQTDGTIRFFNTENVTGFPAVPGGPSFAAVRSLRFDDRGNLWTLHERGQTSMLGCRTPEGSWHFLNDPRLPVDLEVRGMAIDPFGQIWSVIDDDDYRGIAILDYNNTPALAGDDRWTQLRAADANGLNAVEIVTSVAVDLLGDVWIGTDRGLRTIFNPREPERVSKTCFNTRCNIEGLFITCIAVDPVNNKWLGTTEGVFVLTPDGSEILAQYDTDNSPLLDNEIQALTVHPGSGVAYIATNRGLSSLVTPYVQPVTTFEELTVAPNPFRPGIDDRVMIDGLVEGSVIKVLSVSGNLVAELSSPGGRVGFWDGRTLEGDYAPSGVYFVVAAASNGSQAATAKLAVIRP